jgi:hypothetical protein
LNNTHILNSKMTEILKGFLITDFAHFIASWRNQIKNET